MESTLVTEGTPKVKRGVGPLLVSRHGRSPGRKGFSTEERGSSLVTGWTVSERKTGFLGPEVPTYPTFTEETKSGTHRD